MGSQRNIGIDKYPQQTSYLGRSVEVWFYPNQSTKLKGTVIRDDLEQPYQTIIKLDDGRILLGLECNYEMAVLDDRPLGGQQQ